MKKYILAAVATLGLLGPAMAQSQADAEDDETACLIGKAAVFLQSREGDDIDARLVAEYATEHAYSVCPSGALSGRSHAYVVGAIEALAEGSFEKTDDAEQRDLPIFFRGGWCRTADDPGAPGDSVFERQQRGQQCPPGDGTISLCNAKSRLEDWRREAGSDEIGSAPCDVSLARFMPVADRWPPGRFVLETLRVRNDDSYKLCCDQAGKR
jgi:hypothetical protein